MKMVRTSFGHVREDWQLSPLPEVVFFQEGPGLRKWQWTDKGMKVINVTNILGNGSVDVNNTSRYISEAEFNKKYSHFAVESGDVMVASSGNTYGKVGRVDSSHLPLMMNTSVIRFHPLNDGVRADYLYCYLRSDLFRNQIEALVTGSAQPNFGPYHLKRMQVVVPPLPTQRKIAAVLSAYDDLIENNVRRIAILEEMAAALYREWFIELRFPGHASVPIAESEQGRVPQGWEIKTLGDLATDERRAANPAQVDADTPYIGLEHIPRKSIALSEWGRAADVSSAKLFFNQGEILFGKIRPYFHKVAVAPVSGVCSTDAIVIVPRVAELFALVLCCASSEEFVAHAVQTSQGTKMPRANWGVMSRFPVVVPPAPLMQHFNAAVNEMVEQIQKLTAVNANLRATRDLLLPKLVAGEVDVSQLAIAGATEETDETTNGAEDADL